MSEANKQIDDGWLHEQDRFALEDDTERAKPTNDRR